MIARLLTALALLAAYFGGRWDAGVLIFVAGGAASGAIAALEQQIEQLKAEAHTLQTEIKMLRGLEG